MKTSSFLILGCFFLSFPVLAHETAPSSKISEGSPCKQIGAMFIWEKGPAPIVLNCQNPKAPSQPQAAQEGDGVWKAVENEGTNPENKTTCVPDIPQWNAEKGSFETCQ